MKPVRSPPVITTLPVGLGNPPTPPAVMLSAPVELSWMLVPATAVTGPAKLLPALARLIVLVPALRFDDPVTVNGPASIIVPLPEVAPRLPVTVPVPRFSAPFEVTVI